MPFTNFDYRLLHGLRCGAGGNKNIPTPYGNRTLNFQPVTGKYTDLAIPDHEEFERSR
jgi:hypothetical protein